MRRDKRQRDCRVEHRVLGRHRRGRRLRVGQYHMLARPHTFKPRLFGGARDGGGPLGKRTSSVVDSEQSESHRFNSPPFSREPLPSLRCGGSPCPRKRETRAGFHYNQVLLTSVLTPAMTAFQLTHWVADSPRPIDATRRASS